jgi:hypothetical protein
MLANRADTYNLGDIIGSNAEFFKASYIENAVTSNAILAPLANRNQKDVRVFIEMALANGGSPALEGSYSQQELEEILSVMRKLVTLREVILRVNQEYIHSAAQADEFRTEPPFRLQGSYRNMNRLAEKVVPIMNDEELRALIADHYRSEAQTLTTGAEANLLKFKEMMGWQTPEEAARWEDIKKTFRRNQVVRGADQGDSVSRVVAQLASVQTGLEGIQSALLQPRNGHADGQGLTQEFKAMREDLARAITSVHSSATAERLTSVTRQVHSLQQMLSTLQDVAAQQRNNLQNVEELLTARARQGTVELELTQEMLNNEKVFLERVQKVLAEAQQPETAGPSSPT